MNNSSPSVDCLVAALRYAGKDKLRWGMLGPMLLVERLMLSW
jgi:hypothetical protein